MQPAGREILEERAPVPLSFRQRHRDAQQLALALCIHAHGQQHGTVDHGAAVAHLLVTAIEYPLGVGPERTLALVAQLLVQRRGTA